MLHGSLSGVSADSWRRVSGGRTAGGGRGYAARFLKRGGGEGRGGAGHRSRGTAKIFYFFCKQQRSQPSKTLKSQVNLVYLSTLARATQVARLAAKGKRQRPRLGHLGNLSMTFKSLPLTVREIKATEATLERIYEAAYLGLKGDSLALAAGLLPTEYQRLKQLDKLAEIAEMKGRADSEKENSKHLLDAARSGDAKAALAILQHVHGWVAKQAISVEVDQRISVIDALRAAETRVVEGVAVEIPALASEPIMDIPYRAKNVDAMA